MGMQCRIPVPDDRWDRGARFCNNHRYPEEAALDAAKVQIEDLEAPAREQEIAKDSLAQELEAERQKNAALERRVRTTTAALDEAREMSTRLMTERDDARETNTRLTTERDDAREMNAHLTIERDDAIAARDAADADVATLSARLTAAIDDRQEMTARLSMERDGAHAARGYATAQVDTMSAGIDEALEMLARFDAGW